jgi:predicted secreted protein
LTGVTASFAQNQPWSAPLNVLQLQASSTVEVQQDLLSVTLTTTRESTEAKKSVQPGQLDVRTGNFSLSPRYTREGKINGWQGSTELVLEGRDFARITQTASRITTLNVGNVGFGLSREQRAKVETEAQQLAIDNFKQKAGELAKGFGFTGYTLREVSVNASQGNMQPHRVAMQAKSFSAADAALPVEAGKTNVVVNVSGSVQLK